LASLVGTTQRIYAAPSPLKTLLLPATPAATADER